MVYKTWPFSISFHNFIAINLTCSGHDPLVLPLKLWRLNGRTYFEIPSVSRLVPRRGWGQYPQAKSSHPPGKCSNAKRGIKETNFISFYPLKFGSPFKHCALATALAVSIDKHYDKVRSTRGLMNINAIHLILRKWQKTVTIKLIAQ